MNAAGLDASRSGLWTSLASLLASSSTLICCAIPALLVALGAGAALASLVTVFPQLVWISEHKTALFVFAGMMLVVSGTLQWRNRTAPCPTDPVLRNACLKTRKASAVITGLSVLAYLVGGWFAFVLPLLGERIPR